MRSLFLGLFLGALSGGCFDDELLLDKECLGDEDCGPKQECVTPGGQMYGWCRPEGSGCKKGEQPGCACVLNEALAEPYVCTGLFPSAQDPSCICTPNEPGTGGY